MSSDYDKIDPLPESDEDSLPPDLDESPVSSSKQLSQLLRSSKRARNDVAETALRSSKRARNDVAETALRSSKRTWNNLAKSAASTGVPESISGFGNSDSDNDLPPDAENDYQPPPPISDFKRAKRPGSLFLLGLSLSLFHFLHRK